MRDEGRGLYPSFPHTTLSWLIVTGLLTALLACPLPAQELDTAKPLVPSFWWTPGWFMIGTSTSIRTPLYLATENTTQSIDDYWTYVHQHGGNTVSASKWGHIRDLDHSTDRDEDDRIIVSAPRSSAQFQAGFARELQLYPFDSVQTPYYPSQFYNQVGNHVEYNNVFSDPRYPNRKFQEQIYDTVYGITPGQLILSKPVYDYNPLKHIYPLKRSRNDDSARDGSGFFDKTWDHWDHQGHATTFYFVTTAHLLSPLNPSVPDSSAVLHISLWHDIPQGFKYLNNARQIVTAAVDTSILCDSFAITRGALSSGAPAIDYPEYREVSHPSNLATRAVDGGPGPFDPARPQDMGSLNLDIRVYWTGVERVALRSIAIRDTLGELVLGNRLNDTGLNISEAYRNGLIYGLWEKFYGPYYLHKDTAQLHRSVMRFEIGREGDWNETEYAGFEAINRLLRDSLNLGAWRAARGEAVQPGDSASAFQITFGKERFHYMTTPDEVTYEFAFNDPRDTVLHFRGDDTGAHPYPQFIYETPYHQIPTLKQHNGGRGHLPLLMDVDSVASQSAAVLRSHIEDYEITLQRMWYGRADTTDRARKAFYGYPYHKVPGLAGDLLEAAGAGRRYGRRLLSLLYPYSHVQLRYNTAAGIVDTLLSHKPEPAELLAQANIALCYGASGVIWPAMADHVNNMSLRVYDGDTVWTNPAVDDACCQGSSSMHVDADTVNTLAAYVMTQTDTTIVRATFPNFYVGYKNITGAIKDINTKWLASIGPFMTGLRWRNSYSMHFAERAPGMRRDTLFRPLPAGEIITGVTSRHPLSSTADSSHRTYVEIGMFDPKGDTNYLFVVNRRSFERPPEVPDTSAAGRKLDSLAESRVIGISWNVPDPGQDQYPFVRVREVLPDTMALPLAGAGRTPLDTVIGIDGTTYLTLRPGGGALLEVTYVQFDTSNFTGDLRFNSQRKIAFDGNRFHITYNHPYTFHFCSAHTYHTTEGVFYRRSVPVTEATGSVMWEPWEYMVNDTTGCNSLLAFDNVFPSLALRQTGTSVSNTIVTIVWSANEIPQAGDHIRLRKILSNDTTVTLSGFTETVGFARGADSTQWGTPVVSTLAGGDLVAWSDMQAGIIARLRKRGTWSALGVYTSSDSVSRRGPGGNNTTAQYPTMPASAHVRSVDSNVGIAWQQNLPTFLDGTLQYSMIRYARITDSSYVNKTVLPWVVVDTLVNQNYMQLSTESSFARHPSMDLWQDVFDQVYEGVTWDDNVAVYDLDENNVWFKRFEPWVHFRSLFTETRNGSSAHDSLEGTQLWGLAKLRLQENDRYVNPHYSYPNTASLNQVYDLDDMPDSTYSDSTHFSVVYYDSTRFAMRQATIEFAHTTFKTGFPMEYSYGDIHPNGSASAVKQEGRHNVIYQSAGSPGATRIRGTRQFFAKTRPHGYVADGREGTVPIASEPSTGITGMIHDVWYATGVTAAPVAMVERGLTSITIDSLAQLGSLMRTGYFHAHDSTTIGCELRGQFYGDSAVGAGAEVDFIAEVVDSATGQPVALLDSFRISAVEQWHGRKLAKECDLLSGTYYVRLRMDTAGVGAGAPPGDSRYPVAELAGWIEEAPMGRVRRIAGERGADGRLSVSPNPLHGSADILFSVPVRGHASVTLYDARGAAVVRPVERGMMEAGRYAVEIDGALLPPGTYLVELRYADRRLVEKVIVVR